MNKRWKNRRRSGWLAGILAAIILTMSACGMPAYSDRQGRENGQNQSSIQVQGEILPEDVPEYSGDPYIVVNGNNPDFSDAEMSEEAFEEYSELDDLGRCGPAEASVGQEIMPTEERGSIGQVKPTGWHTVKYESVDGKYLYNRCHLLGFQLTGENANEKNLITGTRYMNVEGMLPFENMVADYVKETGNHVMYRVTPVFDGENLVASGVQMEACSVEDNGEGISFNVYVYDVQPGIAIDYETGESQLLADGGEKQKSGEYVLNENTKKFHRTDCSSVSDIAGANKRTYRGKREDLIEQGYAPCGRCRP